MQLWKDPVKEKSIFSKVSTDNFIIAMEERVSDVFRKNKKGVCYHPRW